MPETPEKIWHQLGINDKKYVEWETAKKWEYILKVPL